MMNLALEIPNDQVPSKDHGYGFCQMMVNDVFMSLYDFA
jgi:hypothetical protein